MTYIEKKAREYAEQIGREYEYDGRETIAKQAFLVGAAYALGNQWRDAEKELPEAGTDVVIGYRDRITNAPCMGVGWIDNNSRWYSNDDDVNVYGVVAWLPIPEYKPKGE